MAKNTVKTKDSTNDTDLATALKDIPGLRTGRSFTPIKYLKSGFDEFDKEFLGGGLVSGKITQLWGLPGSGKSLLARRYVAMAQKQEPDKYVLYYNPEFDLNEDQFVQSGVNVDEKFLFIQDNNIARASETIKKLVQTLPISLIVVDSLGALSTDDKRIGSFSRAIKALVNELVEHLFRAENWMLVVNQVTTNINAGPYGNPDTYPGGRAWEHCTAASAKLGRVQWLPSNDAEVKEGMRIRVNMDRNKLMGVKKTDDSSHLNLFFENGIEKASGLNLYNDAVNLGLIVVATSGSKLFNPDGELVRKERKKDGIMNALLADEELRKEVQGYVASLPSTGLQTEVSIESEDSEEMD